MATAFLTRIRNTLVNYIQSATTVLGYFYNYPSADERDLAKLTLTTANAACWFEFGQEETIVNGADNTAYSNYFPLIIHSVVSTGEVTDPFESYKICCDQMLEDFKKLFGNNFALSATGILFWNEISNIEYEHSFIDWKVQKDALTPAVLVSQWKITYHQLRSNPNVIAAI